MARSNLKAKIEARRQKLRGGGAKGVSPFAPDRFPDLPAIDGVRFAAAAAGVRYQGRLDVMLAEVAPGSALAGVFTQSKTRAAPVETCVRNLAKLSGKKPRAPIGIVVNSGNANAFTGGHGQAAVNAVAEEAAGVLETRVDLIFPASTGVIGEPLPSDRVTSVLEDLGAALSEAAIADAAQAIMTTDTYPKGAGRVVTIGNNEVRIAGIAKGSGMIAPDMATMLVYIFTDAKISQPVLQKIVSDLTDTTFNAITVDSDTSTSDTLLVAATGKAAGREIVKPTGKAAEAFRAGLEAVMQDLAHQVVKDGEGATKFVAINVTGAQNDADAKRVALAIANSPLVKTAIAGEDPNWGRIVMAIGKSGADADRDRITIHFGDILVAEKGWVAETYREEDGAAYMTADELEIAVDLGLGRGSATVWTCDLTHGYVSINADYRS